MSHDPKKSVCVCLGRRGVDKQGLHLLNTVTFYIRILLQAKDEDGDRSLPFLSSWLMSWTGGEEMTKTCELTAAPNRAPYVHLFV